jgi:hypothetical protein
MRYAAPVRKYPLQPLQQQREHTVNRDAARLSDAKRQTEEAVRASEAAKLEHQTARQRAHVQRRAEGERAQGGLASASDLVQQAKHDARVRSELAELQRGETIAEAQVQRARDSELDRLSQLQRSAAEAKAAAEHKRRWEQAERKRRTRRDEENAHESWQAAKVQTDRQGTKRSGRE